MTGQDQMWDLAASWGAEERMSEPETLMWRSERQPRLSSPKCSLMILDQAPDWDRFVAAHEWATRLVPRCRQRVLDPLLPVGPPVWVTDEAFLLEHHVRRTHLPGEGTMAQLLELAQTQALTPFDRSRPLWEGTLVEGLEGGRAAYLLKLHHSLTDGLGGIQLMALVQSRVREHTADKPTAEPRESSYPTDRWGLTTAVVREQLTQLPARVRQTAGLGTRVLTYAPRDVIFSQGDPCNSVMYVRAGGVRVSVLSHTGKEAIVATLGAGDFLGEGALAGHAVRLETATATITTTVNVVPKGQMLALLHSHHAFSDRFINHMLARNARLEADLVDQLFNSSEKRLARTLLLLARYGRGEQPHRVLPAVSQEALAEMIGTTRSRVNFFLNKFRKLGFIEYDAEGLTINPSLLAVVVHD